MHFHRDLRRLDTRERAARHQSDAHAFPFASRNAQTRGAVYSGFPEGLERAVTSDAPDGDDCRPFGRKMTA
jgi:hypothetical protein